MLQNKKEYSTTDSHFLYKSTRESPFPTYAFSTFLNSLTSLSSWRIRNDKMHFFETNGFACIKILSIQCFPEKKHELFKTHTKKEDENVIIIMLVQHEAFLKFSTAYND